MNSRVTAIRDLLAAHPSAFFVLSNGLTSREAAHFLREDRCLYMLHGMGETLSVGLGLAQARPDLEIVVIDGDGNALMGLSSWSMMPLKNLHYYILCNGIHETTGGQPIPALPAVPEWCALLRTEPGSAGTPNPPPPRDIWAGCLRWLSQHASTTSKP